MPTLEWVRSYLLKMVYVNTSKSNDFGSFSIAPLRTLARKNIPAIKVIAPPLQPAQASGLTSEKILSILMAKAVRRGSRSLIEPFLREITESINRLVDNNQPINLILPSLPLKDQSPFTTGVTINHTDLSEHAMFAQIRRIMDAIANIYEPGAHMTLLCDGYIYADMFAQGDKDGAGRYKAACEKIKNSYGLHNQVTLFDMREVLFDMPEWHTVRKEISEIIAKLFTDDAEIKERINILARQFVFHVALPQKYNSYENARELYSNDSWPDWLSDLLLRSAIDYCTIHLTLAYTDLVKRAFPSAIRCTVHPKAAAQIPLHLTNQDTSLLPYNGIATISKEDYAKNNSLFESLRVRRLSDVMALKDVTAVFLEGDEYPFYYELG